MLGSLFLYSYGTRPGGTSFGCSLRGQRWILGSASLVPVPRVGHIGWLERLLGYDRGHRAS
jgi:hypothetical protein